MKQTSPKFLATIGAAVLLSGLIGCWYHFSFRPEALLEKGREAEAAQEFGTAAECYTRLARRSSAKWSGTGYWHLYLLHEARGEKQAGAALRAAAERDYNEGQARMQLASACSGETAVAGIDKDPEEAIELLLAETRRTHERSRSNPNTYNYNAACALAEISLFEPGHRNYDMAREVLSNYFDGPYSKNWPQARHLGAIMVYQGKGGYGSSGIGAARGLLNDATLGMPAYYRGNTWLRGPLHGPERGEYCMREALQCYFGAQAGADRFIDRSDLQQRIEILNAFCEAHALYNPEDDGVWSSGPKAGWSNYTNGNLFCYDGQVRGGTPHGIGVGYWQQARRLFCGEWKEGRCSRGILVDTEGGIFTGTFDKKGNISRGVRILPDNSRQVF